MAKEVVNTFVHNGITAEIVKAGSRFSFSIDGKHGEKSIYYCAYCHGLWKDSQDQIEYLAKQSIDDKIAGRFRPYFAHTMRPKPNTTIPSNTFIAGKKYRITTKANAKKI